MYFLIFIDDFTRKTWEYFLHEKSDALTKFKEFKARTKKETCAHILCLRTNCGREFLSCEFNNICHT